MTFFKGYRIESNRRPNFDYSSANKFFITICTNEMTHDFGKISNGILTMTPLGMEIHTQWEKTPDIRPDMNLIIDEFQVMPNHFHGIIEIGINAYNSIQPLDKFLNIELPEYKNQFGPQRKNLSSILRGFKSAATSFAKKNGILFKWQPNFHDIIIRDDRALEKIRNYIRNNVATWERDRLNRGKSRA